ncbi:non-specific serine/threonine protein kinase [Aliiroseovarius halocynthiae]|uniref:Protein kinase n=1 Tax=Aliiroseovarius halocynthiae TaxID=985055 RepID=A0A545SQD2_9RHOB|nr:serine/threonine-protein kinase [Aliiroseovarius halocynthiae]TQV67171.1 protein kinase [Aliiroseovarius halocynthiae]SMR82098.1 non-specific serine/threonine protein kinase [Aliiroseovarius halocynthiae]
MAQTEIEMTDELEPGTKLLSGQYTITSFLNSGGFGITYLAKDSLDRTVVIKECFPEAICRRTATTVRARSQAHVTSFEALVESFVEEARNQSKLEHPNIAGVHQVFKDNDTAYMAIDFVEGNDLLDTLEERDDIRPEEVDKWLRRVLEAVGFIHAQGMLHRDISPDNILINKDGEPVIIDFGAARSHADKSDRVVTLLRAVKEGYSPHELYVQGGRHNKYSDLYSVGATFYHVITGAAPISSQERVSCVAENQPDPYVPLAGSYPEYPKELLESIDRALSLDPSNRFANAEDWRVSLGSSSSFADMILQNLSKETEAPLEQINDTIVVRESAKGGGIGRIALALVVLAGLVGGGYFFLAAGSPTEDAVVAETPSAADPAPEPKVEEAQVQTEATKPAPRDSADRVDDTPPAAVEVAEVGAASEPASEAQISPAVVEVDWTITSVNKPLVPFATSSSEQPEGTFSMVTMVRSNIGDATQDWLSSGSIIYAVNGNLVVDDSTIQQALVSAAEGQSDDRVTARLKIKTSAEASITEHDLTILLAQVVKMKSGLQFTVAPGSSGRFVSRVTDVPEGLVTDLRAGDTLVSEAVTGVEFVTRAGLVTMFEKLSAQNAETAQLTIARDGALMGVELTHTP